MTTKKTILYITYAIAIIGIIAGVILVRNRQILQKDAAPLTSLLFNPSSLGVIRGKNFTVNSKMNSGTNIITGIDIELDFNPAAIQVASVTPTNSLSNFTFIVRNEIDNNLGKIRYIAFTTDKTLGISGNIDLLTISGSVPATATAGSYQISYGSLTTLAAVGEGQNAVLNKTSAVVTVSLPTPVPTASPSPTIAPTIRPTATATATATATSVPTIKPTVTPTVTFSPIPNKTGDINSDGSVDMIDIGIVVDNYEVLPITVLKADLNSDGAVNMVDIGIVVDNYER